MKQIPLAGVERTVYGAYRRVREFKKECKGLGSEVVEKTTVEVEVYPLGRRVMKMVDGVEAWMRLEMERREGIAVLLARPSLELECVTCRGPPLREGTVLHVLHLNTLLATQQSVLHTRQHQHHNNGYGSTRPPHRCSSTGAARHDTRIHARRR